MAEWFTCACDVVDDVDGLAFYNCSHRNLTSFPACLQTYALSMYDALQLAFHKCYNPAYVLLLVQ